MSIASKLVLLVLVVGIARAYTACGCHEAQVLSVYKDEVVTNQEASMSPGICGYGNGSNHLTIFGKQGAELVYSGSCRAFFLYLEENPDVTIEFYFDGDVYGYAYRVASLDRFNLFTQVLDGKPKHLDLLYFDSPWLVDSEDNLLDLDGVGLQQYRNKWKHQHSRDGTQIALTTDTNQMVFFYRRDLFEKWGKEWPMTWEDFESTLQFIQEEERKTNPKFVGLVMPFTPEDPNVLTSMFVTFLSGHEGGKIVEDNGTISVNNKGAVDTLRRWKSWRGVIMNNEDQAEDDSEEMFRIGNSAVTLGWSQDTEELMDVQGNASAGAENWTFSAGPIPGNGSGCAGDWSIVVNRHTTNAPAAIHFLQFYLSEVVPRVGLSGVGHEPILNSLMPNGTAWGTYCATNPILCESYERYPEFWDRLTYRPSLGCKNKYSACLASIGEAIRAYFTSSWSPENAVAAMEVDLKRVLGYTNHQDAVSQFDWTWSRILVFVTVALAMANFAFFASRYWQLWSVRQNIRDVARTRRTVPMAVAFGLIILVFLGFVACALIYIQTTSTTDFANRLGATKRKQALLELNRFVVDSLVKFKNEQLSAESNIMRTVASAKNAIGRVDFESASLVLMIDRDLGTVLASSNLREQPDDVSFTTDGNGTGPWLAAAIKGYPAWNRTTLDPEEYLTTRAGETLYVSMSEVTKYLSHTTTVRWLLLYFAPRAVVLEESSKVFAQALDISIILTVASVCIALALAYAITSPLAKLANDIDTVSAMNFDALRRSMKTKSYFTESTVLLNGFKKMAQILKEYKSFIPRVLFVDKPPNSRGNAAVVCTEVQNSAKIWLWNSAVMRAAKEVYNDCVKCCFNTTGGFEASAFGDSFMICFNYLDDASAFAVTVQEALYRENSWPVLLNDCEYARVSEGWNGLRVKVGLCWGPVDVQVTSVSGKSEYCGPTVIRANQICKACSGGAVAMTSEGFCAVSWKDIGAGIFVVAEYNVTFSETSDSFDLHLLVPGSLQVRAEAVRLQFEEANRLTIQGSNPLTTVSPYPHSQTESSPRKSLDLSQNTPSGVQPTPSPPVRRKISASALTKPASCVSSAAGTSRPDSVVPRNLKQRLFVKVCTVGHLCADLSLLNNARDALADVNEYLSRVSTAVDRTSGALVSLSSNNSVIAWNGIKENQSHVASAIRFATLLHKSSSSNNSFMCADNLQFGLAVGTGLAGNVRAADQKFVMLIGTAVEVAGALARAARAQYIYCLAAALPGHDSLSQEKAASGRIRPIDTWLLSDARGGDDVGVAVGEDDTDAESMSMSNSSKSTITVYELDTKADTNVTFQHVNPPWGWSNLYAIAFHCRNWKEIEANTKNDRVLRKVVQRLREETARPLVFCSYDAPADPLGTRGLR